MNKGKICVSVCAETAVELFEKVKRAEVLADVIEIRFDCIKANQFLKAFSYLNSKKILLLTYRSKEQGGKIEIDKSARIGFWNALAANGLLAKRKFWIDCEFDLKSEISNLKFQKIFSFHDFETVPENLESIFESLSANDSIAKIAVQANDITDTIEIWKLLEKARSENKEMIPIAMGEAGKWTRIMGLAHGAHLTYASLDAGQETAPGQVSAEDLIEVYRAKQLNENTDVYGIIGGNTSYSMSPYLHNAAFKFHRLNAVFVPLQVKNLGEFMRRMVLEKTREIELNFKGFAVTNPHKQTIIEYLDELDETARKIGAVNTIKIENGKLYGYNTDAQGFIEPLKTAYGDLSGARVAVFGGGGAAGACIYALEKEGADITIFARNPEKTISLAVEFNIKIEQIPNSKSKLQNFDIVVNTTPLGTSGEFENDSILQAEQINQIKLVYDLVYNPFQTKFLREASQADVPGIGGMAMLIAQAMIQQKIWTGLDAPQKEMAGARVSRLP